MELLDHEVVNTSLLTWILSDWHRSDDVIYIAQSLKEIVYTVQISVQSNLYSFLYIRKCKVYFYKYIEDNKHQSEHIFLFKSIVSDRNNRK